jgi:hypothetical protein
MKLNTPAEQPIETSGVLDEAYFGISIPDQAMLLSFLRDKVYSDKVKAVIREYSTNAIDAHVMVGTPERPFDVTLPSLMNPYFIIRDYGPGLSKTDVFEKYIKYGASDKRDSNEGIGQLGLGCKAGFAYGDTFTITSWYEGVKSIYTAYIDESKMGKVAELSAEPSDEPSGVEIKLAVYTWDIDSYKAKARRLYKHFDVKPNCDLHISPPNKSLTGKDGSWWMSQPSPMQPLAIMGQIAYPINIELVRSIITDLDDKQLATKALEAKVTIKFDIGDLDISLSREALEYTTTTKENLKEKLLQIVQELGAAVGDEVSKAKTYWQAKKTYYSLMDSLPQELRQFAKAEWRGEDLRRRVQFKATNRWSSRLALFHKDREVPSYNIPAIQNIQSRTLVNSVVVINDVDKFWIARTKALRDLKNLKTIIVFKASKPKKNIGQKEAAKFIKDAGIIGIPVYCLSDVQYIRRGKVAQQRPKPKQPRRPRNIKTVYKFIPHEYDRRYRHHHWEAVDMDIANEGGVYVEMRYDKPTCRKISSLRSELELLKQIKESPGTVYGIKSATTKRLGPKWIKYSDFLKDLPEKYFKKFKSRIVYQRSMRTLLDGFRRIGLGHISSWYFNDFIKAINTTGTREDNPFRFLLRAAKADDIPCSYSVRYRRLCNAVCVRSSRTAYSGH